MSISQLSTEILQKIFEAATVKDVIHLAQTSKKNYQAYLGRRVRILEVAVYNSYSPVPELLKLVIANEPDKSRKLLSTEHRRNMTLDRIIQTQGVPKLSLELIVQMVQYGKVADRWAEAYPRVCWRHDSINRRFLRAQEQERLRGAIYRFWTYSTLFQDQLFTQYDPDAPQSSNDPRFRLLRTYSTMELIQLTEFHDKIQEMIQIDLCPSNSMVRSLYPYPMSTKALANLGWGDDELHRNLVLDLMKLSPADLLHLFEHTTTKAQRVEHLMLKGKQFLDTPATMRNAIAMVQQERKTGVAASTVIFENTNKFGIVDRPEWPALPIERETHPWATDANLTGEAPAVEMDDDDEDDDYEEEDDEAEDEFDSEEGL